MTDALGTATAGLRAAENQMSATAGRIVRLTSVSPTTRVTPVEASQPAGYQTMHAAMPTSDLAQEMVNLKQEELGFRASVAAFKAADRMTKRTLDILA